MKIIDYIILFIIVKILSIIKNYFIFLISFLWLIIKIKRIKKNYNKIVFLVEIW